MWQTVRGAPPCGVKVDDLWCGHNAASPAVNSVKKSGRFGKGIYCGVPLGICLEAKGLVLSCQMRSEIDGRVSKEHRLSRLLDRAVSPSFVQSVQDRGRCKCVPYKGECSNKVLNNRPFWVVSSTVSSNQFHLVKRSKNNGQSFLGKMDNG